MTEITLGFILIATLILWFVIGSKGHWLSKAVIILLSLYFCLSVGFSINNFVGWPTNESLPPKFLVHWAVIDEPDAKSGEEGNIYIWIKPLSVEEKNRDSWNNYLLSFYEGGSKPRAYRLPYSRELHEQAQEVIGMIMQGQGVGGTNSGIGKGEGKSKNALGRDGKAKGEENGGSLTRNGGIMFHRLPPPKLPNKD